jgi:hypothetical protein
MEQVLTYYCKIRAVEYKQGMCHLLAPLLITYSPKEGPLQLGSAFKCFDLVIDRFLPNTFTDAAFENLRCVFRY